MSSLPSLPVLAIAQTTAILLGLTASSFGLTFLLAPITAAASFGVPIPEPLPQSQDPLTTFLLVLGGRNLAIGLTGLALAYQRDFKAIGTLLLCLVIPGTLDSVLVWRRGVRSAAWGHIGGTVVFVVLGAYFVFGSGI